MSTAKRDIYWDIIKGVAIFLVVLGHSLQYFYIDSAYSNTDFLFNFIYSFHMPLFMVVSGYFAYSSFSKPIYEVFKKKFIQIMIPNVTWSLLTSILVYLNNPSKSFSFSLGYWYLNALWGCYVIFGIGNSLRLKCSWLVYPYILMVYAFGELLNISHLISMLPFFGIGLLIRKYPSFLEDKYKLIFSVTFPLIILISILYPSQLYNMYSHPFEHSWGAYCTYVLYIYSKIINRYYRYTFCTFFGKNYLFHFFYQGQSFIAKDWNVYVRDIFDTTSCIRDYWFKVSHTIISTCVF